MSAKEGFAEKGPLWYKDAVIYELHIKAFCDSDGDGVGDFKGLITKLDYLKNLGITAIWLLPFYPSPLKDDGYDIADYFSIHPSYGTLKDFKELLKQAHRMGMRVITELVLNHTSDQHPWFQKSRVSSPGSKWRNYYVWSDTPDKYRDARVIFQDFETSNWTWDPAAKSYFWHRFYSHQPDLNYDNPEVQEAMFKVLDFWFGLGVDGMRIDAVPYLFEREGTNCENLPETHEYLKKLRAHIDKKFSDKMLLAEANQWPEDAVEYFGKGDECNMAFNFPVMPRMFMSIQLEDRFPLVDILESGEDIPAGCQWAMFLRNHDELTLEMVTDEERDSMYRFFATDPKAKINLGIRRRLAPLLWNNPKKIEIMNMLLFSLPGTPVIYYGDEICMGDNYYLGDRDGVRTPMQWTSYRNAGFSDSNPQQLYLPVIIDPEYHYENVNVENQERNLSSPLWWMKRVIAMRKQYRAFGRGSMKILSPQNAKVFSFVREYSDEKILVIINMSRFSQVAEIGLSEYADYYPKEVFSHNVFPKITAEPYVFTLGPYNYFWFVLEKEKPQVDVEDEDVVPQLSFDASSGAVLSESAKKKMEVKVLPKYLRRARWFGGKGRIIRDIKIKEEINAGAGGYKKILLVKVNYADGVPDNYFVPVFYARGMAGKGIKEDRPDSVLAVVSGPEEDGVLYDGVYSPEFREMMLDMIVKNKKIKHGRAVVSAVQAKSIRKIIQLKDLPVDSVVPGADQSNTSIIYGQSAVLKFYRKAEVQENPDIEILRVLDGKMDNIPHFGGLIEFRKGKAEIYSMAMLQSFVVNEGDAWKYALDHAGKYYERVLARKEELNALMSAKESGGSSGETSGEEFFKSLTGEFFSNMMALLGQRTAEMHIALAAVSKKKEFIPEQFSILYQRSVYQAMRNLTNSTFRVLSRNMNRLEGEARIEAEEILSEKEKIFGVMKKIAEKKIRAVKIRIHGDYHLGQVLFTGNDFVIIDFEGEPARPLTERKLKRSPLRDIAGMLRSFHYAAYASLLKHPSVRSEDTEYLEPWAEAWFEYVKKRFMSSYLKAIEGYELVPGAKDELKLLLDVFTLGKAVYELGYEANSRPGWMSIPIKGIKSIIERGDVKVNE